MAPLRSTLHYITLPWLHFTLLYITLHSTSPYFTLHYTTMVLHQSTLSHITLPWLYFTLLYSKILFNISSYFTPLPSTIALLHSTRLYINLLPYHGSTSLYVILHYSTKVLLPATLHCITLLHFTLLCLLYHGATLL